MVEYKTTEIGADYQEVTAAPAPVTPTGHFALYVWIAGTTSGTTIGNVNIIQQTGFNATTITTTPLGGGAILNSSAFDFNNSVMGFSNAMAFSDQASATNGFMIEQSIDGTHWDLNSAATTVSAGTAQGIKAAQVVRFGRVRYINGAVAQGVFRLGARFTIS